MGIGWENFNAKVCSVLLHILMTFSIFGRPWRWSRTEQTFALKFSQPIPISTHHCVCECVCVRVCTSTRTPSCPTLCVPLDCSLPGSSVCGIFQTRIRELVAISFSRGSSQPRDRTYVSCLPHWQVGSLPAEPLGKPWATRDAHCGSFTEIWNP